MQAVSVIATVLNEAEDIPRLVDSLLRQQPAAAEIIIVDGGSTDGTWERLSETAQQHSNFRPIRDESCSLKYSRGPVSRGRNVAIAAASSELIACADAGCTYAPDWLARLTGPLQNGEAEYALGGARLDMRDPTVWDLASAPFLGVKLSATAKTKSCTARSMAFTKDLWQRSGGFPETVLLGDDTHFDLEARRLTQPAFLLDAKAIYRPQNGFFSACKQLARYSISDGILGVRPVRLLRNAARCIAEVLALAALPWTWIPLAAVLALEIYFAYRLDWLFLRVLKPHAWLARLVYSIIVPWIVATNQIRGGLTKKNPTNAQNSNQERPPGHGGSTAKKWRLVTRLPDLIRRHHKDAPLILFLAAGVIGVWSQGSLPARRGGEMWNLAWSLADQGRFADPFNSMHTGATASNPPLAPLITAILIRIFRTPFLVYLSSALLSVLANAVTAALLPRLSWILFDDIVPGVVGGALWMMMMHVIPGWDTNYTAMGLVYFACLTRSIFVPGEAYSWPKTISAGALAGALCLLNPASLLIWLPWLIFVATSAGLSERRNTAASVTIVAVMCAVVSVWCVRNEYAIGAFSIRTGLGIELYVSNNDCALPTILQEEINGCFQAHHPNTNLMEAREFERLGEVAYNKARTADAVVWMRAHPGRFAQLTLARFRDFWFPLWARIPSGYAFPDNFGIPDYMARLHRRELRICISIWLATILSFFGLVRMLRERQPAVWFLLASLTLYPLVYYITIADIRYRYPLLWLTLMPAGYFVCALIEGRRTIGRESSAVRTDSRLVIEEK